jgi:Replication initiation factor
VQFDWYQATIITDHADNVITGLALEQPSGHLEEGRGQHGYKHSVTVRDEDGDRFAQVHFGGANGVAPHVVSSGHHSPVVADTIRRLWPVHEVTRADIASDMRGEGLFETLMPVCKKIMRMNGMDGNTRLPDEPGKGTTYYMGSPTSLTSARLYEKGKEQFKKTNDPAFLDMLDWTRLELQARPKRENRLICASMMPHDFWGLSRWAQAVAATVLDHEAAKVGVSAYRRTDKDNTRRHMCHQYGNLFKDWVIDEGSPEAMGRALIKMIEGLHWEKGKINEHRHKASHRSTLRGRQAT